MRAVPDIRLQTRLLVGGDVSFRDDVLRCSTDDFSERYPGRDATSREDVTGVRLNLTPTEEFDPRSSVA